MAKSQRTGKSLVGRMSFERRHIHCAVLLALGPTLTLQASAQSYTNYDGSKSNDFNAAVATWANNAEFKSDWGLGAMNAQFAYALGFSGKGVKLGSVDSGYLTTHQEFANRGVTALAVTGTYLNDGSQNDGNGLTWKAGDSFNVPGSYNSAAVPADHVGKNDNHGNHVSGTIAAGKNGVGMMGVSFNSQYFITNSNGTDGSIYGPNMDYNYFKAAYGNLAAAGVRVINSSWGSPVGADDFGSVAGLKAAYDRLQSNGTRKSWPDAAAEVSQQTGVLQVFAAGNTAKANVNIRSALPYFRPELEKYWITAVALKQSGATVALDTSYSNSCGIAKYWCIAAPGSSINSANITGNDQYKSSSGTSMAAPHVTGALGVLMERYPTLGNEEIRTILLTTAKHLGTGPLDVPNAAYGWGVVDLQKGMHGPSQFLGAFKASLPVDVSDTWSNNISEAALIQRQKEDAAEIAAWIALPSQLQPVPEPQLPSNELVASIAQGKALLQAAITANTEGVYTEAKLRAALAAVNADPVGKQLLALYEQAHPGWTGPYSQSTDFDNFIGGRGDFALAQDLANPARAAILASNAAIQAQMVDGKSRISYLQTKTAADYVGSLIKTGANTLTLTGDNSYSGGTQLQGGTLGVGSSTALGTGTLAMSDATTLQAATDGLTLANAVTLSGIGNIDTQAYEMTLSGAISDGATSGGLAKLGTATLTLSGANTYSGPTGVMAGTLRAGSATGFSPRSAFVVATNGQLDLNSFSQTIGSLSGAGNVSLGTATLTTGGDNSTTTFSGQIAGSGGLTKTGSGTFTLASAGNNGASGTGALMKDDSTSSGNTYSGATTVAAGTLQAGAVNTFSPASAMTVNTGATLDLAGYNQRVAGMNLAGTVSVAGATPGTTLTVTGPWTGNGGLLKLGTVSPAVSDRVLLSGTTAVASGTTTVQIGNVMGLGGATTGNGIELIGTTGGASIQGNAFVLAGGQLVGGAYEYRLNNISSGGYLSSSSPLGQTYYRSEVPLYSALPAQLRQASLTMLGNMHQRTGDDDVKTASGSTAGTDGTTSSNDNQRRAWGRLISTNLDIRQSGTVSPQSHGRLDGFQAGTDLLSVRNWRAGVYVGQLDGDMGVSGFARGIQNLSVGRNDLRNQYMGAYGTYSADNGFYADAVLQAGRHRYDIVSPMTQAGSGGSGKGRSLLASVEVGQSFALGGAGNAGEWKIEPQFQLIHQRQSLDDVSISGNTLVRQRPDNAWLARLGVRIKGEVGVGVARLQPYARFNLYRASGGNDVASFMAPGGRTAIASSTGGTSAELAAGATLALTPSFALYGELGKLWSAGGDTRVKSSVQASVGARVLW